MVDVAGKQWQITYLCQKNRGYFYSSSGPSAVILCCIFVCGKDNKCLGKNKKLAIAVGITALPMTPITKNEYWDSVTIPCVNPYKADIVPNVNPVDIISV